MPSFGGEVGLKIFAGWVLLLILLLTSSFSSLAIAGSQALDDYLKRLGPDMQRTEPEGQTARRFNERWKEDLRRQWISEVETRRGEAARASSSAKKYLQEAAISWRLAQKRDELNDRSEITVTSTQSEGGVTAEVRGYCTEKGNFAFDVALVPSENPSDRLGFPDATIVDTLLGPKTYLKAVRRINDLAAASAMLERVDFSNNFRLLKLLPTASAEAEPDVVAGRWWQPLSSAVIDLPQNLPARLLAKIRTSQGDIVIRIALADPEVATAVQGCMERDHSKAGQP